MAAAVSNADGLGSVGVGSVDAEVTRRIITAVRSRTDRPFNVNVFCHQETPFCYRSPSWQSSSAVRRDDNTSPSE
jgi:NAD(P)H-dependent flavin oxidoreductase YrpB (nitropropane dioxygenase family)